MRPRFSAAGGKSDSFDAFVLAELARTDSHRFRVLVPDTDATKALRALSRAREDLVGHRVALANELRAQLECFWPGAASRLRRHRQPDRARLPAPLPGPGRRARSRRAAPGALPRPPPLLRPRQPASCSAACAPPPTAAPPRSRPKRAARSCSRLVAALEPIVAHIAAAHQRDPRRAARPRRRRRPSASLFVDPKSAVCAATLLSEIGDCRDRYPTIAALAADGGQAPVAIESGKSKRARFRWACDHRLRDAIATLADTSRHHNPWAADIYPRARARRRHPPARDPHPRPRLVRRHLAPLARPRPSTTPAAPRRSSASSPQRLDTGSLMRRPPLRSAMPCLTSSGMSSIRSATVIPAAASHRSSTVSSEFLAISWRGATAQIRPTQQRAGAPSCGPGLLLCEKPASPLRSSSLSVAALEAHRRDARIVWGPPRAAPRSPT